MCIIKNNDSAQEAVVKLWTTVINFVVFLPSFFLNVADQSRGDEFNLLFDINAFEEVIFLLTFSDKEKMQGHWNMLTCCQVLCWVQ